MNLLKHTPYLLFLIGIAVLSVGNVLADEANAERLYQEGKVELLRGHTAKAEIKLLLAKRDSPSRYDIVEELVKVYLIQKEYKKGLVQVDELLKAKPKEPEPHLLKGRLLQHQGDMKGAEASYITATAYALDNAAVLAEVGGFYLLIGDAVQAETYSQRVKALQNK